MKISLIFPPSWLPSQPFLSLPVLTAFLRKEGVGVTQRDLNIEFLEVLLSKEKALSMCEEVRSALVKVPASTQPERYNFMRQAVDLMPFLTERVEWAKGVFRSEDFYDIEKYMEALKVIDKYLEAIGTLYYPSSITNFDNNMRYSVYSSADIMSAIRDENENVFLGIFRENFLSSILDPRPDIVGLSITSTSQLIPGLTLARLVKEADRGIHVTVGGSVFTKLIDNLLKGVDTFFSFVDSFVVFEGEHALLELADQISGRCELSKVPNLIYCENGSVRINEPFHVEDVSSLPTPDYDGLPLGLYHSPKRVLPVQTSRGCYWGKCTFCNLHYDHKHFRPKADLVVRDIQTLKERYDTNFFFFADECIPVGTLKRLVRELPKLDIKWIGGVRFEEGLSRDLVSGMRAAGCLKLVFGLESYSQRVLGLMKKGTKRDVIRRILEDCLEEGIAVHVYTIVGFPTETAEEAFESANFILDNERLVSSLGFSFLPCLFEMEKHSPITRDPASFGIRRIMAPKKDDLSLGYFYEVERGMSLEEAEQLHATILDKVNSTILPFPYNYSMSDGLLYIERHTSAREHTLR
ncbi:MAG: B12-binding domain-containing radical SAM protein [Candidatus Brocadiales bacterium]